MQSRESMCTVGEGNRNRNPFLSAAMTSAALPLTNIFFAVGVAFGGVTDGPRIHPLAAAPTRVAGFKVEVSKPESAFLAEDILIYTSACTRGLSLRTMDIAVHRHKIRSEYSLPAYFRLCPSIVS